jgi:hypothetical protein
MYYYVTFTMYKISFIKFNLRAVFLYFVMHLYHDQMFILTIILKLYYCIIE